MNNHRQPDQWSEEFEEYTIHMHYNMAYVSYYRSP